MAETLPAAARPTASVREARENTLRELVAAIAAGDGDALARFYDGTRALVFALALRLVGRRDLAEEVTLEVFEQVWRRASTFDAARGEPSTWLLAIARSRALDRRRADRARASRETAPGGVELERALDRLVDTTDPALAPGRTETSERLAVALASLPDPQRRAIELAYFPGMSHTQIAVRLGEPLGTVKTRIRLGMIRLKDVLQRWEDDA